MSLQFRELPGGEWQRLVDEGVHPYSVHGLPPDNGHWRVLVAEQDGKIVGATALHTQVHWEPWHIGPDVDGLGIVRGLLREGKDLLDKLNIDHVFCAIPDGAVLTRDQAERLGFKAAPGQLYLLNLPDLKL